MPVAPADLLAPAGPVEETLFPGEGDGSAGTDLEARLLAYIGRAEAKTAGIAFPTPEDAEYAQERWALHLTFDAAYTLAISRPASENSMVQMIGAQAFSKDQRDALKAKAAQYAAEYERAVLYIPAPDITPSGYQSRQSTNTYDW